MGRRNMQGRGKTSKKGGGFNMVAGVRLALDPETELYAAVLKVMGGGMCSVKCQDNTTRTCVIRQKFRGRDKRHNLLGPGSWVLVGLRDWEGSSLGKTPKCDLLEVYNAQEKDSLVQVEKQDLSVLIGAGVIQSTNRDTEFDFVDAKTEAYRDLIDGLSQGEEEGSSEGDDTAPAGGGGSRRKSNRDRFMGGDDEIVSIDDI